MSWYVDEWVQNKNLWEVQALCSHSLFWSGGICWTQPEIEKGLSSHIASQFVLAVLPFLFKIYRVMYLFFLFQWQCPTCMKNYSLENIVIDPYFNRITTMVISVTWYLAVVYIFKNNLLCTMLLMLPCMLVYFRCANVVKMYVRLKWSLMGAGVSREKLSTRSSPNGTHLMALFVL